MARLLPWLRLVRAANGLTAAGNVLAGAALAHAAGAPFALGRLSAALGASLLLYSGGCILNDWADLPLDRLKKPERPLPSGAVHPTAAIIAAGLMFVGALGLGQLAGTATLLAVCCVLVPVLVYDLGAKRHPWPGIVSLAAARGANGFLGVVALSGGWPTGWLWLLGPVALAVFVAGVTWVSTLEDTTPARPKLLVATLWPPAVLLVVPWFAKGSAVIAPIVPALVGAFLGVRAAVSALRHVTPATIGGVVRAGVLAVPLLDATVACVVGQWGFAAAIVGLAIAARLVARKIAT